MQKQPHEVAQNQQCEEEPVLAMVAKTSGGFAMYVEIVFPVLDGNIVAGAALQFVVGC